MSELDLPLPYLVLHGGDVALACAPDGQVSTDAWHGLFAADTRVLSSYRLSIEGQAWDLLGSSKDGYDRARWEFQNPLLRTVSGDITPGSLLLSQRRRVDRALHDDLVLRAFVDTPVRVRLVVQIDADFSDIFEVKASHLPPRTGIHRAVFEDGFALRYARPGFRRGLRVKVDADTAPTHVGAHMIFDVLLERGVEWRCCIDAAPEIDGEPWEFRGDPHAPLQEAQHATESAVRTDEILQRPFDSGRADLHSLALEGPNDTHYVAAGVPWFLTVFGRDPLVAGLMSGIDGPWVAEGALAVLAPLQARERDDWRDAEPGKLPHELRRGELAHLGLIPHTPYYGTHDAPALYCLALWHAWRWTGNERLLDDYLATARAALAWCDEFGDRDGDGLQEYGTRSKAGYYNQGWKDAGEAIVHTDGALAEPPLATVELQGYLFAARLAMAELLDARGDAVEAARQRQAASTLRETVERRYWMDSDQTYALAIDGPKRPVTSIASNPGHLLWCGLPSREHAEAMARRLLEPDMCSGWGLRTLSTEHPAYNPLSYQNGSVWPHDTLLTAAGFARYGLRDAAAQLMRGVLEAANRFEDAQLPEVFCGLARSDGPPVPYLQANRPQAWAAAAPLLAVQLLLGIVPDAPHGRCYVDPWLPAWLSRLDVRALTIGRAHLDIAISRRDDRAVIEEVRGDGIDVVIGSASAPLWGDPQLW
jgi:glycogen debranching enzyme